MKLRVPLVWWAACLGCGGNDKAATMPATPPANDISPEELHPGENGAPRFIVPYALERHRSAGSKQIQPWNDVRAAMRAQGIRDAIGAYRFCVDETGHVTSASVLRSTQIEPYDQKVLRVIKEEWTFRPIVIDGSPAPVCSLANLALHVH